MTPNQKHAQEEYDRFMPQLRNARATASVLAEAKTPDDIVKAFAQLGYVARVFLDTMIEDYEKRHTEQMNRNY